MGVQGVQEGVQGVQEGGQGVQEGGLGGQGIPRVAPSRCSTVQARAGYEKGCRAGRAALSGEAGTPSILQPARGGIWFQQFYRICVSCVRSVASDSDRASGARTLFRRPAGRVRAIVENESPAPPAHRDPVGGATRCTRPPHCAAQSPNSECARREKFLGLVSGAHFRARHTVGLKPV